MIDTLHMQIKEEKQPWTRVQLPATPEQMPLPLEGDSSALEPTDLPPSSSEMNAQNVSAEPETTEAANEPKPEEPPVKVSTFEEPIKGVVSVDSLRQQQQQQRVSNYGAFTDSFIHMTVSPY